MSSMAADFMKDYRVWGDEGSKSPCFDEDPNCVASWGTQYAVFKDGSVIGDVENNIGIGVMRKKADRENALDLLRDELEAEYKHLSGIHAGRGAGDPQQIIGNGASNQRHHTIHVIW